MEQNLSGSIRMHRERQVSIADLFTLSGTSEPTQFPPLLLVFLTWKLILNFFYILGPLHVYDTNNFLWGQSFVITTHHFVHVVFPYWLYVPILYCPIPILTWSFLSIVYNNVNLSQEMPVDIMGICVGFVLAVLWQFMLVILAHLQSVQTQPHIALTVTELI